MVGYFEEAKVNLIKIEAIAKEKDSPLSQSFNNIHLLNAQVALSERDYPLAIKFAEQISAKSPPAIGFESHKHPNRNRLDYLLRWVKQK